MRWGFLEKGFYLVSEAELGRNFVTSLYFDEIGLLKMSFLL